MTTRFHYVDIGAHWGEALEEALRPRYRFVSLRAIEPSKLATLKLSKFRDHRVQVENWGAWSEGGVGVLHSAGSVGASLFADKKGHWNRTEIVELKNVRDYFDANFTHGDGIYLKINIEGAELHVLKQLLGKPSETWRIVSLLLSVDLPKIPSLQRSESELRDLLAANEVPVHFRKHSYPDRAVRHWLGDQLELHLRPSALQKFCYYCQLPMQRVVRRMLMKIVPKHVWISFANHFGPNRFSRF